MIFLILKIQLESWSKGFYFQWFTGLNAYVNSYCHLRSYYKLSSLKQYQLLIFHNSMRIQGGLAWVFCSVLKWQRWQALTWRLWRRTGCHAHLGGGCWRSEDPVSLLAGSGALPCSQEPSAWLLTWPLHPQTGISAWSAPPMADLRLPLLPPAGETLLFREGLVMTLGPPGSSLLFTMEAVMRSRRLSRSLACHKACFISRLTLVMYLGTIKEGYSVWHKLALSSKIKSGRI